MTGQLRFGDVSRSFSQSFLLCELADSQQGVVDDGVKRAVFYVRSEVLTLNTPDPREEASPREEAPIAESQAAPVEEVMEQRPHREAPTPRREAPIPHREAPTPRREAPMPRREALNEEKPKSAGKPSFEM